MVSLWQWRHPQTLFPRPTCSVKPSLIPIRLALFTMLLCDRVAPLGLPVVPCKIQGIMEWWHLFQGWASCALQRGFPGLILHFILHWDKKKMVQVQLNRIHMEPSHLHQPLRKGWVARTAEARGEARTFPPSYRRRQKHGLVSEGRRQRKWDVQLPMSPVMNPTTRHGAGRSTYWSKLDVDGLVTGEALLRGSQLLHVAAVPSLHHLVHVEGARQLGVQRDDNG